MLLGPKCGAFALQLEASVERAAEVGAASGSLPGIPRARSSLLRALGSAAEEEWSAPEENLAASERKTSLQERNEARDA